MSADDRKKGKTTPTCPTCKKPAVVEGNKAFPFCSSRCQMVDLGRWLDEEYRLPAPVTERDVGVLEEILERQKDEE